MNKTPKRLPLNLLLLFVAIPTMTLASQSRSRSATPPSDPHQGTTLLIKAFVVRVNLQSLYALGASPLDLGDQPVSVAHLQTCLKEPSDALVIAGKRVAVGRRSRGTSSSKTTIYLSQSPDSTNRRFNPYSAGIDFSASASLLPNRRVSLEYSWDSSSFQKVEDEPNQPPSISNRSWNGSIHLDLDTPQIVGSVQDEKTGTFLVLSAHIQSSNPPQDAPSNGQ